MNVVTNRRIINFLKNKTPSHLWKKFENTHSVTLVHILCINSIYRWKSKHSGIEILLVSNFTILIFNVTRTTLNMIDSQWKIIKAFALPYGNATEIHPLLLHRIRHTPRCLHERPLLFVIPYTNRTRSNIPTKKKHTIVLKCYVFPIKKFEKQYFWIKYLYLGSTRRPWISIITFHKAFKRLY